MDTLPELIAAAQAGESEAYATLVQRFQGMPFSQVSESA